MENKILSIFSGGGFLDIGFINQGFQINEAIEVNPSFAKAYNTGISNLLKKSNRSAILQYNITHNEIKKEVDASSKEEQNRLGKQYEGITGLIGGPPCQDFSNGGKHKGHTGERGKLIYSYLEIVKRTKPEFVFFENVSGLRDNKEHQLAFFEFVKTLEKQYTVVYEVLNCLNYGVPQDRPRITLVGFRNEIVKKLIENGYLLKDEDPNSENLFFKFPRKRFTNPKSIEWPRIWEFGSKIKSAEINKIPQYYKGLCVINAFEGIDDDTINQQDQFEPYSAKFQIIGEGDTFHKSFKRLHRYRYSPAVAYGNNEVHLHPTEARRISVREALRLQSVSDSYIMPSDIFLTDKYKIISNGVPVKKAELIAKEIRRTLENYYALI